MENMKIYKVYPAVPESLSFLNDLARNLWWCWNHDAIELFQRINPALWESVGKNPLVFLSRISQRRFEELSRDESFLGHLNRIRAKFEKMLSETVQIPAFEHESKESIAYFSMEFGLHESLPFFAGGLGILAGDHLKASSGLGIPLIGIGLMFREGYFKQYLDQNGWQLETYPIVDVFDLPVQKVTDDNGADLVINIPGPDETIYACVWQILIGRIRLLLLDTDLPGNSEQVRDITARLYASDSETRVAQEVLLGIGGVKTLEAMGIFPNVCHLNEGHCAFAVIERAACIMDRYSVDFETAFQICLRTTIFTTHTPVAAGHDMFDPKRVIPYLTPYCTIFGKSSEELVSWGKPPNELKNPKFSMFIFGVKFSGFLNGVSRLHGQVARQMWQGLWPKRFVDEIPISHVTNGIHINSYLSRQKNILFERYLSADWAGRQSDRDLVSRIDNIEDSELWHVHELDRSSLVHKCRNLLLTQYERRNAPRNVLDEVAEALDYRVLTICFARRFATYKRAGLLLKDIPRLTRLITDQDRPIQFIFAGKAHPNDNEGKEIIKQIVEFARRHEVRHSVAFLENYDTDIARFMVQGGDVWLNTPRRPNEACGTSGMKAAANGGLNLSILDGWWCEGFRDDRGWAIGNGEYHEDPEYQDEVESQALFNIIENEVIPTFYERKRGNPPIRWIKMMKEAMKMAIMDYSSDHMVREYSKRFYLPAIKSMKGLTDLDSQKAKELAIARERLESLWADIRLSQPEPESGSELRVGDDFTMTLEVDLGQLTPDEVEVQLYHGRLAGDGQLEGSRPETMRIRQALTQTSYLYECRVTCSDSGRFGYTARVIPNGDNIMCQTPGLITWAHKKEKHF
jgi:starch phosphorylase